MCKKGQIVAIVGRPNVGKSSLFNRIINRKKAIVHKDSGITRDRIVDTAEWCGRQFLVIDTGGLGFFANDVKGLRDIDKLIAEQVQFAIDDAQQIIFVVDAQTGVTPLDAEVARLLRPCGKCVHVAVNKADNEYLQSAHDWSPLGFGNVIPISCLHNVNIGDLLDQVTADFSRSTDDGADVAESRLKLAVIGRPNVGKSSFINVLLREKRVVVSDKAGTTRDAVDIPLTIGVGDETRRLILIDTAGIRKKSRFREPVDYFSFSRARSAIKRSDLVLIMVDAASPISATDRKICQLVMDHNKACIILANKWDIAGQSIKQKALFAKIRRSLPFMAHAPLIACCAISGYNFRPILRRIHEIANAFERRIATAVVNDVIRDVVQRQPPPADGRRSLKIYYGILKASNPVTFLLFVNKKSRCRNDYLIYLRNQLRKTFNLAGHPIVIEVRERKRQA